MNVRLNIGSIRFWNCYHTNMRFLFKSSELKYKVQTKKNSVLAKHFYNQNPEKTFDSQTVD